LCRESRASRTRADPPHSLPRHVRNVRGHWFPRSRPRAQVAGRRKKCANGLLFAFEAVRPRGAVRPNGVSCVSGDAPLRAPRPSSGLPPPKRGKEPTVTFFKSFCGENPTPPFLRNGLANCAQFAFKVLMIHKILQFILIIAFCCVLHRLDSLDIRC
jgi:hypothetical protein